MIKCLGAKHINALPGFIQALFIVNRAVLLILVPFLLAFQSESKKISDFEQSLKAASELHGTKRAK